MQQAIHITLLIGLIFIAPQQVKAQHTASAEQGYNKLVTLFDEFREAKTTKLWSAAFDDPDAPYGVADYRPAVMQARLDSVTRLEAELKTINPERIPVSLIRYEMLDKTDQVEAFWQWEEIPSSRQ